MIVRRCFIVLCLTTSRLYLLLSERPGSLIPRCFPGVYRLFAGLTPVIAAELAILLDESVAGDHQGDWVGAHHEADGTGGHL